MPRIVRKAPVIVTDVTPEGYGPTETETETETPAAAPALPTVAELEADARAGRVVSLSDLAGAIHREGATFESKAAKKAPRRAAPAPIPAPEAPEAPAGGSFTVPASSLVLATADGPDADLYEAPRDTAEERAALVSSLRAGGIAQPIQAVRRTGPDRLVVLNGRRRVLAALAIDALYPVPVVVRPDVVGVVAELAAAELNETGVSTDPSVLVDRLVRARAAGVDEGALIRAAGRASRVRSLLVFADRAGPELRDWLSAGTVSESTACLMAEATDDVGAQRAALALLTAEIDKARNSPDRKSAGLTGSRKGDATIDDDGRAHVTRAAAAVAVSRALAAAGVESRRTATVAPAPAPVAAPLPVHPDDGSAPDSTPEWNADPETETETAPAPAPESFDPPAPAPAPIAVPSWAAAPVTPAPKPSAPAAPAHSKGAAGKKPGPLSGSVTAAAGAALARAYGIAPSTLTGDGRGFLSGVRAALDYLTTGNRPTGDVARRFGATFDVIFPE